MILELGGLELKPRSRIFRYGLRVIIPAYRSPYGGARVAQTNVGGTMDSTQ
jgi:hypothetical protein